MLPTQSSFLIPQRFLHVPFLCRVRLTASLVLPRRQNTKRNQEVNHARSRHQGRAGRDSQAVGEMDVGIQSEKIVAVSCPAPWQQRPAASSRRAVNRYPVGSSRTRDIGIPGAGAVDGQPGRDHPAPESGQPRRAFGGVTTIIDFAGDLSLKAISGAAGIQSSRCWSATRCLSHS